MLALSVAFATGVIATGATAIMTASPSRAEDGAFAAAVAALASSVGVIARPGRNMGCRRAGECRATLGHLTLRSAGTASGTTLTLRQTDPTHRAAFGNACATTLAALSDLDHIASRHVVRAAATQAVTVDAIRVTQSTTPAGLVCRLQIPPQTQTLANPPRQ